MPISDLHGLFIKELKDILSAEELIVDALPKMIEEATDDKLQSALVEHLEMTDLQIDRLEQIAASLGWKRDPKLVCKGMKGILDENEKTVKEIEDAATKDAAIIAGAQKVEHYEIAVYGSLVAFAKKMEHEDEAGLLAETLDEEEETDKKLSGLAQGGLFTPGINDLAAGEEE